MILQKYVNVKINSRNFQYYKDLIPDIKNNKVYNILVCDLLSGSHTKILVSCDVCSSNYEKPYRQYKSSFDKYHIYCCSPKCAQIKNKITNIEKYGVSNVFQSDIVKNKIIETNLLKYGVSYPSQSSFIRSKIINTLKNNYGVSNPMYSETIKNRLYFTNVIRYGSISYLSSYKYSKFRIENGTKIPNRFKTKYRIYQDRVRYLTNKIKKSLFNDWDGYDYYDNEYIKNNLNYRPNHKKYPTMDHKLSIYYGFKKNIIPELIANIKNLCITKRTINSRKNIKTHYEFYTKFI
jgi:hypothetical protein